jgi:hypothetical protein
MGDKIMLICVNDKYDPTGDEPYTDVDEFIQMCIACFGEFPILSERGNNVYDQNGAN